MMGKVKRLWWLWCRFCVGFAVLWIVLDVFGLVDLGWGPQ